MVELAFLEDPYRKTILEDVAAARGPYVVFARSIYYARSTFYGHPQPCDRGHFVVEGHKLKVDRVTWRSRELFHHVTGPPPSRGSRALCHLDWERRHRAMRAHLVMHLLHHAVVAERRGSVERAEVTGGGLVRAQVHLREPGRKGAADLLQRINGILKEGHQVAHGWYARDVAEKRMTGQGVPFEDVAPGEPSVRMVDVGDFCRIPCDAPNVKHTADVGRVVAPMVRAGAGGAVDVQLRVVEAD